MTLGIYRLFWSYFVRLVIILAFVLVFHMGKRMQLAQRVAIAHGG